jgi:hypothetical protein
LRNNLSRERSNMAVSIGKLTISYKFLATIFTIFCSTLAVANKWIEGVGFVTIVVTVVPAYLAANVIQKRILKDQPTTEVQK